LKSFPENEYHVPFFDEVGYVRKKCPVCGGYFWTQNPSQKVCGEATPEGCAKQTFIGNSPTRRSYSLKEMREAFLGFFERNGHERVRPYPVVARWRDDLYLTHASIIDFQPYVTNGIVPPPANPLVISQPCIRLVDVDNVGPTFGRHLTFFEMGGHHAFNYPDKEVYWKDQTVRYHHEFVTEELGIKSEEVVYKEDVWVGGGNAGPDLETIVRGLEIDTLVFMKFKVVNNEFVELPIRTVDTGYGIDRYTWLSQGSISAFHAIYDSILKAIFRMAGIGKVDNKFLTEVSELSGLMSLKKTADRGEARRKIADQVGMSVAEFNRVLLPIENAFAVADHTKCLAFMLAEGIVPSNVREGYLARLMIRRTHRLLRTLGIEERFSDIIDMQIDYWSQDFPYLKEMRNEILEILSVEQDKFRQTLERGSLLVKRIVQELKKKRVPKLPIETLSELYDSHGLPPEIVQETAEKEGVRVDVPEDFYTMVAERHVQAPQVQEIEKFKGLEAKVSDLPNTQMLYYEDAYLREFEAKFLRVVDGKYVVLDKTAFYPEGGGQPADYGVLKYDGKSVDVVDVQKVGNVIVHVVKDALGLKTGSRVKGSIDWDRRSSLMKHHTATHVINGAARRVLGQHVWQAGSQKDVDKARLDISHFRRISLEEMHEIERLANETVIANIPVQTMWLPRTEAERKYGFRLYQGGAIPGKEIRIVKTESWETEACGGTHLRNTGEIGFIKILRTERIQDGVERLVYSAGISALKTVQESERLAYEVAEILDAPLDKLAETAKRVVNEWKEAKKEKERLLKEIVKRDTAEQAISVTVGKPKEGQEVKEINGLKFVSQMFDSVDVDRMIMLANEYVKKDSKAVVVFCGADDTIARLVVMAGEEAVKKGVNASEIAKEASAVLGGGGSGRPNFAQGGGTQIKKVQEALKKAEEIVKKASGKCPI
jgi:alanyl-tRNA synthetase